MQEINKYMIGKVKTICPSAYKYARAKINTKTLLFIFKTFIEKDIWHLGTSSATVLQYTYMQYGCYPGSLSANTNFEGLGQC